VKDFCLKAKARIWPRLSYVCYSWTWEADLEDDTVLRVDFRALFEEGSGCLDVPVPRLNNLFLIRVKYLASFE